MVKKVLTINYSDTSGNKGIQDDLRVFQENHVFGFSAISAIHATNQNKTIIDIIPTRILAQQLDSIFIGGKMDAIKIESINNKNDANTILSRIRDYPSKTIVLELSKKDLEKNYYKILLPIATLVVLKEENVLHDENQAKKKAEHFYSHEKKNCLVPFFSDENYYLLLHDGHSSKIFTSHNKNVSAFVTAQQALNKN